MLDFLKALLLFAAYALGLKTEKDEIEAKADKAALDEANKTFEKQDEIRLKYDKLKNQIPDDSWDSAGRLRATKSAVSKTGKA